MSDIRLFISTHKENVRIPKNPLVFPVQVGTALRNRRFDDMFHDNDGVNISDRNKSYCELTAQYWAWKNINADYYGFFHYRRYLSFASEVFPTVHEPFIFDEVVFPDNSEEYLSRIRFDEASMRSLIEEQDFVATCASASLTGESVYEQYENSTGHHIEDLQCVMAIIRNRFPEQVHAMETYLGGTRMYCCNMYIMKRRLFHEYCRWLFSILEEFESRRDLTAYPPVDGRVTGYLAERLCGIYLTYLFEKGYKGVELQKVYFRETDPAVSTEDTIKKYSNKPGSTPAGLIRRVGRGGKKAVVSGTERAIRKVKTRLGVLPPYDGHREDICPSGVPEVTLNSAIRDHDGRVICYFDISEIHRCDETTAENCELSVTDSNGNDILTSAPVIMKESLKALNGFEEYCIHTVRYSCKLNDIRNGCQVTYKQGGQSEKKDFSEKMISGAVNEWERKTGSVSHCVDYHRWYINEHRVKAGEINYQKHHEFDLEPMFSIIVPLYHTPIQFFTAMADSVLAQTYGKFELILVNASPADKELSDKVREYAGRDPRIRFTELQTNLGITENTNAGIGMARGDFICFLDHDDLLESDTLFEYAAAINKRTDTDLLYCDEDKLYGDHFTDPYFKPDYNPDLLMGINYVCHFLAVRSDIVDALIPATREYDGAQDYHMTFRVAEKARYVNHVSRVLYHWRIHENSTASDPGQKSYTQEAAKLCVKEHLRRCNISGRAVDSLRIPRYYEVIYELPYQQVPVSLIICNRGSATEIKACVDSVLLRTSYRNYEIIIVDDREDNPELNELYDRMSESEIIRVVHPGASTDYAKGINYGFLKSTGEYIVALGYDTRIITDDWIQKLLGPCMRRDIGAVGAKVLYPDGTLKATGIIMTGNGPLYLNRGLGRLSPGYYNTARLSMDVTAVSGICIMTSRRIFTAAGGFNEILSGDFCAVDYCLKLREAGYLVLYEADVEIYDYQDVHKDENSPENRLSQTGSLGYLMQRWGEKFLENDPYYNGNFAKRNTYFNIY